MLRDGVLRKKIRRNGADNNWYNACADRSQLGAVNTVLAPVVGLEPTT